MGAASGARPLLIAVVLGAVAAQSPTAAPTCDAIEIAGTDSDMIYSSFDGLYDQAGTCNGQPYYKCTCCTDYDPFVINKCSTPGECDEGWSETRCMSDSPGGGWHHYLWYSSDDDAWQLRMYVGDGVDDDFAWDECGGGSTFFDEYRLADPDGDLAAAAASTSWELEGDSSWDAHAMTATCAAGSSAPAIACTADDIRVKKPDQGDTVFVRDAVTVKWEITDADCDDEFSTVQIQLCPEAATTSDASACGDFILDPTDQTGGVNYFFKCNDEASSDGEPWECVGKAEPVIDDLLPGGTTGLHKFRVCGRSTDVCDFSDDFTLQLPGGTFFPTISPPPTETPTSEPSPLPTTAAPSPVPSTAVPSTAVPTAVPSSMPSPQPSVSPHPTPVPSSLPTSAPTPEPSPAPSPAPTSAPTSRPSLMPTPLPSPVPTAAPSPSPTTAAPSPGPTFIPTPMPSTAQPSPWPTPYPSPAPTPWPSPAPTETPTSMPSPSPTTAAPSPVPSPYPTPAPTPYPSVWKSTNASGAQFFTKSFLGDDATVLAPSSDEEPASPRHRAGVASMAWRTTR